MNLNTRLYYKKRQLNSLHDYTHTILEHSKEKNLDSKSSIQQSKPFNQ